jgi:hypothetical protein
MKEYLLLPVIYFSLLTPPLFGQTNAPADSASAVATPPPIPEEARKHFVMGETMFKEAKSTDNFSQAASEFSQAANLAPQWPEARYNLALAKEAAGDYSGALDDLKIYQHFKLTDDEARAAQDKIYTIEAKQQMQASDATAKTAADAANAQAQAAAAAAEQKKRDYLNFVNSLAGPWNANQMDTTDGWNVPMSLVMTVTGNDISIQNPQFSQPILTGTIDADHSTINWTAHNFPTPVSSSNATVAANRIQIDFPSQINAYYSERFILTR